MSYTAKEIADKLEIPPTTIRTWADRYEDFIPSKETRHGRRRYNDEAVEVFRRIEQLHGQKLIGEQVKETLEKEFRPVLDGLEATEGQGGQVETGLVPYRQLNDMLQFFRKKWQQDADLIELQRQEIKEIKEQTKVLKEALGIGGTGVSGDAKKPNIIGDNRPTRAKKLIDNRRRASKRVKKESKGKGRRDERGRFRKRNWWERLLGED